MKIRCNTCENLKGRKCVALEVSVSPNKSRVCEYYSYDDVLKSKIKSAQPIHITQAPLSTLGKKKIINTSRHRTKGENYHDKSKHPLTGDLSRSIKSSATKKGD